MRKQFVSKFLGTSYGALIGGVCASIFLFVPALLAEEQSCVFRRGFQYGLDLPINSSSPLGYTEIHIMLDTNAFLFRRQTDGMGVPELVENYEVINDGKTMAFKLREDCGWSDGNPITAENMIAGLRTAFLPDAQAYNPGRVFFKDGAEVLNGEMNASDMDFRETGEFSFEIDIAGPSDMMPVILTRLFTPFPSHLSAEDQEEWFQAILPNLSSGPYRPRSIDKQYIILERNPHYCKGDEPVPDIVEITNVETTSEAVSLFMADKIDFVERFKPREYDPLVSNLKNDSYDLYEQHDEVISYASTFEESLLSNETELRQALAMMIDYDVIGTISGFEGLEAKANPHISYPYIDYSAPLAPWMGLSVDERMEMARALLEKHGYTDENPLKITLATAIPASFENLAVAIKSMWSRVPVETELFLSKTREEGRIYRSNEEENVDVLIDVIGSDYPDPSDFLLTAISFYDIDPDGEFMKRVDQSFDIKNRQERFDALADIDADLVEQARVIPLNRQTSPWLFQNGFQPTELFNLSGRSVANDNCR